jgi:peptide methionine sulfoxide reductase msrA/msrB
MNLEKPKKINNDITDFQEQVMFNKATERAFSGEYDDFYVAGDFTCRNCGINLYSSKAKFDAGCGWPAFDDCYDNAIKYETDSDGRRTEILCNNCGIHLGHFFEGEHLTNNNARHCVNSASIKFKPTMVNNEETIEEMTTPKLSSIIVGCGCFWGVQHYFDKLEGVKETKVGYAGGETINPSYREVCEGDTGHYEVIKIDYDPTLVSFEKIIKYFFEIHDYSQVNGQGNDIGQQYQSVIFVNNDKERKVVESLIAELIEFGHEGKTDKGRVATHVLGATKFYEGEGYHQEYYAKNGEQPYCHFYKRIW